MLGEKSAATPFVPLLVDHRVLQKVYLTLSRPGTCLHAKSSILKPRQRLFTDKFVSS